MNKLVKDFTSNHPAIILFIIGLLFLIGHLITPVVDIGGIILGLVLIAASLIGFFLNRKGIKK